VHEEYFHSLMNILSFTWLIVNQIIGAARNKPYIEPIIFDEQLKFKAPLDCGKNRPHKGCVP
jgi:hypothetical protein